MKGITVRLIGGLGNQLHCYAFGRALAEQNDVVLEVDCESGYWNDPFGRSLLLDMFPALHLNKKKMPLAEHGRLFFKLSVKMIGWISQLLPLRRRFVVTEGRSSLGYQLEIHRTKYKSHPYFMGYWASYRYYEDVADQLRRELFPPRPTHPRVLAILSDILSVKSCSIHWRSYAEEVGVKRPSLVEYYQKAIATVERLQPDIRFYVFSDNPEAARSLLENTALNLFFVDLNEARGDIQSLNDFYLMYACKHAIIGDSTFSWWAAWLSDFGSKTIVAPRGLSPWGDDWCPQNWISIDVK